MILREYVQTVLRKPLMNEALAAHILNFYEDLDMSLGELYEVVDAIRDGSLDEVTEKMDGQNVTFTIFNEQLQLYSKGASWKRILKGGLTRETINSQYADRPTVREAFLEALDAIQAVISADPENAARLFQQGQVVVESSIQMPGNPNTIIYDDPSIQFIQAVALGPDVEEVDQAAYREFISAAQRVSKQGHKVDMGLVPYLKLQKSLENDDALADKIKGQLDALLSKTSMKKSNTIGDMAVHLVRQQLDFLGTVPPELMDKAAQRIGTGVKSVLTKKEYVSLSSPQAWADFQALDKRRNDIVAEALVPLEQIIQLMGVYAFRNLEFAIAANSHESGEDLRQWVSTVKAAFSQGNVIADPKTTDRIRIALQRIGDQEPYFEKAVEGIVFKWKGKTRKLTGLFTPINKLRGFFAYGANPAQVRQAEGVALREGGNAFKGPNGELLTTSIERERVKSTLDHFAKHVLEPAGVQEYTMIGSTGKKARSGDLDIAVPVPAHIDNKAFKKKLLGNIQSILSKAEAKAVGSNLAVAYPIIGSPNMMVQIDLMLARDLPGTTWLMTGHGEEKVKGVYRNMLLAYLAKMMGEEMSTPEETVKATLSFPGGLMIKKNGVVAMERTSDPSMILSVLGLDVTPDQVRGFEELVDVVRKSPRYKKYLGGFMDYIGHLVRSDPDNAKRAGDYIQGTNEAVLRAFIRQSLRG